MRVQVATLILIVMSVSFSSADTIDLSGTWCARLDPTDVGETAAWFQMDLNDHALPIDLPGTLDHANIGHPLDLETMAYATPVLRTQWPSAAPITTADEAGHLVRERLYIGRAWYQREIHIPEAWREKVVRLTLERVMWQSDVWVNDRHIGSCDSLVAPHVYELGTLSPGEHRLTIRINNDLIHNIGIIGHAYGPETQTRWNGIVGRLELTAHQPARIDSIRADPREDRRSVRTRTRLVNALNEAVRARLSLSVEDEAGAHLGSEVTEPFRILPGDQDVDIELRFQEAADPWDEFAQPRYFLKASLESWRHEDDSVIDRASARFAFRSIERKGRHMLLNGRRLLLRGTLDCAVYPNSSHPPMSLDEWMRILGTIREYGFNHVRFHTWCPPEAAFEAADRLGVYLAPETPFWVDNWTRDTGSRPVLLGEDPNVVDYVRREMKRISDAYGNHPSFALFCIGNEFGMSSDWRVVDDLLADIKSYDDRRLYNACTARRRVEHDDYWVTHSTGAAPTRGVGPAHTNWDFDDAAASVDLPLIAHETGQRPVFPDYEDLLPKFTGSLRPLNLERLQRLFLRRFDRERAGDFERASALFQIVQYKAEHEGIRRTRDFAGYQLLMLNDFTGQSEALVGILDPFWESRGVVSARDIRKWNSATTPLARFDRFVWTTQDEFEAPIEVSHFGPHDLPGVEPEWRLTSQNGEVIAHGVLGPVDAPTGRVTRAGVVVADLSRVAAPAALLFTVKVGPGENDWPIWVCNATSNIDAGDVILTDRLDARTEAALDAGRSVLLLAHGIENQLAARSDFPSVYWSAGWWGDEFSSLGIVCNPEHPALALFPNAGHSDWQWADLLRGATTFTLDEAPDGFEPIVQAVPDFHFCRLLGQVFEARVGAGRLLVCGYDLTTDLEHRHAARQFKRSLLAYMNSTSFNPDPALAPSYLRRLLQPREPAPEIRAEAIIRGAAALHIKAAERLESMHENIAWRSDVDKRIRQSEGYDVRVVSGGTWKDDDGSAWHGDPLVIELDVPAGGSGTLYLHVHDWNGLDRRGVVDIEDRSFIVNRHDGEGRWLAFVISEDDTRDGRIRLSSKPTSGPNIMISELLLVAAPE